MAKTAAWQRAEGKSKTGGLNAKGVASYRKENPGSKLQTAVTTKPSKLKPGSKDAKRRAKEKGIEFSITEEDFNIPEFCPVTGLRLQRHEKCLRWDSPSLDRVNNSKGYIKGNVAVISNRANMIKKDASINEIEKLLIYMKSFESK